MSFIVTYTLKSRLNICPIICSKFLGKGVSKENKSVRFNEQPNQTNKKQLNKIYRRRNQTYQLGKGRCSHRPGFLESKSSDNRYIQGQRL